MNDRGRRTTRCSAAWAAWVVAVVAAAEAAEAATSNFPVNQLQATARLRSGLFAFRPCGGHTADSMALHCRQRCWSNFPARCLRHFAGTPVAAAAQVHAVLTPWLVESASLDRRRC